MNDRLFSKRSRPDDDFVRESRELMLEEDESISAEDLARIEAIEDREDELEREQIAARVSCPECLAPAGSACSSGSLHYGRRVAYARGG